MESDRIFIHFEVKDDEISKPSNSKNTPQILKNIDLYILWCLRYNEFEEYFISMNSKIEGEIDLNAALSTGKNFLNNRALTYLRNIDIKSKKHQNAIKKVKHPHFIHCLDFSISIFKEKEEYNTCAFLQAVKEISLNEK